MLLGDGVQKRLRRRIARAGGAQEGKGAQPAIEAYLAARSPDEVDRVITANAILCSDWVVSLISDLRGELPEEAEREGAKEEDVEALRAQLRMLFMGLVFYRDRSLRESASIPSSLRASFEKWRNSKDREERLHQGRTLIESKDFNDMSAIARRDILLESGKAGLACYQQSSDRPTLERALKWLSDATRLCPGTSPDYAECTLYGGMGLLALHDLTRDSSNLETALNVLAEAVPSASDSHKPLVGLAANMHATALVRHFDLSGEEEELEQASEVFVYGIGTSLQRSAPIVCGTARVATWLTSRLGARSAQLPRLENLIEVLELALERGEFEEDGDLATISDSSEDDPDEA